MSWDRTADGTPNPAPGTRTRRRWPGALLTVLVVLAVGLGAFEFYADRYQPLHTTGFVHPEPSTGVHRVSNTGPDYAGPAGATLGIVLTLVNNGPWDVRVRSVSGLTGDHAQWADSTRSLASESFHGFSAHLSAHGAIDVRLVETLPDCRSATRTEFDTVEVSWSALGRRHTTALHLIGDVPVRLCAGP